MRIETRVGSAPDVRRATANTRLFVRLFPLPRHRRPHRNRRRARRASRSFLFLRARRTAMPLLGLFRREKDKESKAVPASSKSLRPPQPRSGASNASNETDVSSTSKFRMGLFGRKSLPRSSSAQTSPLAPPPPRSRLGQPDTRNASSQSLPMAVGQPLERDQTPRKPRPTSSKDAFTWAARSRSKSNVTAPPVDHEGEFNLRAFRHVRTESPVDVHLPPLPPPPSRTPPPGMRPRGDSTASDSSQKVTVAAFRQAQARRSSTNIDNPNGASTSNLALTATPPRPPRGLPSNTSISQMNTQASASASASTSKLTASSSTTPTTLPNQRRYTKSLARGSSSSSSESDTDTEPGRRRTITRRTYARAKSEIGHAGSSTTSQVRSTSAQNFSSMRPSGSPVGRSSSLYHRERAAHSTSALGSPSNAGVVVKGHESHYSFCSRTHDKFSPFNRQIFSWTSTRN